MKNLIVCLLLAALLTGCGAAAPQAVQNGIEISQARVLLPGGDAMAGMQTSLAAFLMIKNSTSSADRLVGVSADFAEASLHETKMSGDVMSMDSISGVDVPAGQLVELRSGSYHIMFMNVTRAIKVGETVSFTLEFEKAGKIIVPVTVTDH